MKIEVNTQNWYCRCCGSGVHWDVTLFDDNNNRIWGTSCNDQFGGTYRDNDDESVSCYSWEDLVKGMKVALEATGHTVYVEEHIDDSDPCYESNLGEEDD